jgi:hypothetical protein
MTNTNGLTATQWNAYTILQGMNDNGPLTDAKRALFMSVDLTPCGITADDKSEAVRAYESIIGLIIEAGAC